MAINDEIAAGVKPIQLENPLNNMVKFANIQNDMANLQLHRQKAEADAAGMARKNELYNYLGSGGRDPNRIFQLGGHEELNQIRQGESARISGEKTEGETLDAAIKRNKGLLQDFGDTPKAGRQLTYMQFTDPVLKKYFNQLGVSLEQALARIPDDPTEYKNWRQQSIIGMDKHLDNLAFKTPHNLGNRIELTNSLGESAPNPMMIGATIKERSEISPDILTGLANQDEIQKQIAQGNPAGQAPVANQTNQLLNASVAQANDQTAPPISPLAANVNRQQEELAGVNAKLRADQKQALADKAPRQEFENLLRDRAALVAKLGAAAKNDPEVKGMTARINYLTTHQGNEPVDLRKVANTVPGESGSIDQFNIYGQKIGHYEGVAKPSAQFIKTREQTKTLGKNLDLAIAELENATKDGGLIDQSTGSGLGKLANTARGFITGGASKGAIAGAKLAPIADLGLKMVPRFEGPQSDKDTQSYKEASGQLADTSIPNEIRKDAGKTVLRLLKARKGQFVTPEMAAQGEAPAGGIAPPAGFVAD